MLLGQLLGQLPLGAYCFARPTGVLDLVSKLGGRKAHFFRKLDVLLLHLICALSQNCHVVICAAACCFLLLPSAACSCVLRPAASCLAAFLIIWIPLRGLGSEPGCL